jgi:hypothetical protein
VLTIVNTYLVDSSHIPHLRVVLHALDGGGAGGVVEERELAKRRPGSGLTNLTDAWGEV